MTRKLKMLGLTLAAIWAVGAVAAAGAQAIPFAFKTDGGTTEIKGAGSNHKFAFDGGTLECPTYASTGSIVKESETLVAENPGYAACSFFIGINKFQATVHMNGCKYLMVADNNTGNGEFDVNTTIGCPAGEDITVTVLSGITPKCTIHIPEQPLGTGMAMTNGMTGGVKDITADINLSKIKYDQTAGMGIGACGNALGTTNGTYGGSATYTGFNTVPEATDLWVG